jgi:hypothetical protein
VVFFQYLIFLGICNGDRSYEIKIGEYNERMRTSTSFHCSIMYNCSVSDIHELIVFKNDTTSAQCTANVVTPNNKTTHVIVICTNITNNAGRNWSFVLGSKRDHNPSVINETFSIILKPLPLNDLPNFDIVLNNAIASVSVLIPNCEKVCEIKYLTFQCGIEDKKNMSLFDNCSFICPVKSNSFLNITVTRWPVIEYLEPGGHNHTFPMDKRSENITIGKTIMKFRTMIKMRMIFKYFAL